jgi:hypothetical protein
MRRGIILFVTLAMTGCGGRLGSMASETADRALSATSVTEDGELLNMILTAASSIVGDLTGARRRVVDALAVTIVALDLDATVREQGEAAVLELLCSAPVPGDMPETGVTVDLPGRPEGEGEDRGDGHADVLDSAETGRAVARLVATGTLTGPEHLVSVEVEADAAAAQVRFRGGGWLLCALFTADLEVDGEPWDLPRDGEDDPTLDIAVWTPDGEEPDEPAAAEEPDDLLQPVEVVFAVPLPLDALLELLDAELLTFRVGEEAIDLRPADSEPVRRFSSVLRSGSVEDDGLGGPDAVESPLAVPGVGDTLPPDEPDGSDGGAQ